MQCDEAVEAVASLATDEQATDRAAPAPAAATARLRSPATDDSFASSVNSVPIVCRPTRRCCLRCLVPLITKQLSFSDRALVAESRSAVLRQRPAASPLL